MKTKEKALTLNENIDIELHEGEVELIIPEGLSKDLKKEIKSVKNMSREEIRALVDNFYQIQDKRIALQGQIRALRQQADDLATNTTADILEWQLKTQMIQEKGIKDALETVAKNNPVGKWLMSIKGIGPLIAAALIAYFDVTNIEYATHFISYAGLNDNNRPWLGVEKSKKIVEEVLGNSKEITDEHLEEISIRSKWKYGYLLQACTKDNGKRSKTDLIKAMAKIPYNKNLKVLMFKIESSFVKVSGKPDSLYGRLYRERKILETQKNENGDYADQAARILKEKNFGKDTDAYKAYIQGKLPKAHIDRRAQRWVAKIFVSHVFEEMYRETNKKAPAKFYSLEYQGHNDYIGPEIPFTYYEKGETVKLA